MWTQLSQLNVSNRIYLTLLSFGCPIIYTDTIYYAILFTETLRMLDTIKLIPWLAIIASNDWKGRNNSFTLFDPRILEQLDRVDLESRYGTDNTNWKTTRLILLVLSFI